MDIEIIVIIKYDEKYLLVIIFKNLFVIFNILLAIHDADLVLTSIKVLYMLAILLCHLPYL